MPGFRVTYEIVTPESAEIGDAESRGYVHIGEWKSDEPEEMSLREAMRLCSPNEDCGRWFAEIGEDRCDYRTGAVETRSIHPPRDITESSYARVKRVLGC